MALSPIRFKALVTDLTPGKYSDEGGLILRITPAGGCLWQLKYRVAGREKLASFGAYPAVSLAAARRERDAFKATLRTGTDPLAEKREARAAAKFAAANTFGHFADQLLAQRTRELKGETLAKWTAQLGAAKARFGKRPIAEITAAEVLDFITGIQATGKVATGNQVKQKVGATFRLAAILGACAGDPTAVLKGHVTPTRSTSRAAIVSPARFAELLRAVWSSEIEPTTIAGLKLLAYTAQRSHMVREMRWRDLDLDAGTWSLAAEQMKGAKGVARAHVVPLPRQAIALLKGLRDLTGHEELVLPGRTRDANGVALPMDRSTMRKALAEMQFAEQSAHGFRASFYTIARSELRADEKVLDLALAHVEENEVRRAYDRSELLPERRALAQQWADYIDGLRNPGEVVPIRRRAANRANITTKRAA